MVNTCHGTHVGSESQYEVQCEDNENLGLIDVFTTNESPEDCEAVAQLLTLAATEYRKHFVGASSTEFLCFGDVLVVSKDECNAHAALLNSMLEAYLQTDGGIFHKCK